WEVVVWVGIPGSNALVYGGREISCWILRKGQASILAKLAVKAQPQFCGCYISMFIGTVRDY
ncbi:MAG: hypothetical protein KKF79_10710, partial [Gammaproteobacteria bacterium]|nr:hypothetical protein [Gammaproteobacteria bacterium]